MGLILGICGSAFAFSFARAYEEVIALAVNNIPLFGESIGQVSDILLEKIFPEVVKDFAIEKRGSVAKVPNFANGIATLKTKNEDLRFVDAGLAFNLPYPPAQARGSDVMIFFDASGGQVGPELELVEKHARDQGHKFPQISLNDIDKRAVTIFADEQDKDVPLVLYMPRTDALSKANTEFPTAKFDYTASEFNLLADVTESNMKIAKEEIKEAIIKLIERHGGFE